MLIPAICSWILNKNNQSDVNLEAALSKPIPLYPWPKTNAVDQLLAGDVVLLLTTYSSVGNIGDTRSLEE